MDVELFKTRGMESSHLLIEATKGRGELYVSQTNNIDVKKQAEGRLVTK